MASGNLQNPGGAVRQLLKALPPNPLSRYRAMYSKMFLAGPFQHSSCLALLRSSVDSPKSQPRPWTWQAKWTTCCFFVAASCSCMIGQTADTQSQTDATRCARQSGLVVPCVGNLNAPPREVVEEWRASCGWSATNRGLWFGTVVISFAA